MKKIIDKFNSFLKEGFDSEKDSLIENVKKRIIDDYLGDDSSWEEFIDQQTLGDCQGIISSIIFNFPQFEKRFGEIKVDHPYRDENGRKQTKMTHHWVLLNGEILEFSKGTLRDYIDWDNIYDVETTEERYSKKNIKIFR